MSITWRRLGFLGFMIPLALWALAAGIWGVENFKPQRVALLLSATIVWFLGRQLNASGPDADGEAPHQAFGFPMQWSAVPILGLFALTFT